MGGQLLLILVLFYCNQGIGLRDSDMHIDIS